MWLSENGQIPQIPQKSPTDGGFWGGGRGDPQPTPSGQGLGIMGDAWGAAILGHLGVDIGRWGYNIGGTWGFPGGATLGVFGG